MRNTHKKLWLAILAIPLCTVLLAATKYSGTWFSGGLKYPVLVKTDDFSPPDKDSGSIITNLGATGAVRYWLPEASTSKGKQYNFLVATSQKVSIDTQADDSIVYTGLSLDTQDCITNSTKGSFISLVAIDDCGWYPMWSVGTWTDGGTGGSG